MNYYKEKRQKKRINLMKSVLALRIIRFLYLEAILNKGKDRRFFGEGEIAKQLSIKVSQANLYLHQLVDEKLINTKKVEGASRKGSERKYVCYFFGASAKLNFLNWEPLKVRFTKEDVGAKMRFKKTFKSKLLKLMVAYDRLPFINKLTSPLLKELMQSHLTDDFIFRNDITLGEFYHLFSVFIFKKQKTLLKQCLTKREQGATYKLVDNLVTGQLGEKYRIIDKNYLRF